jgi:hypothetical protein
MVDLKFSCSGSAEPPEIGKEKRAGPQGLRGCGAGVNATSQLEEVEVIRAVLAVVVLSLFSIRSTSLCSAGTLRLYKFSRGGKP